jgi:hypothetical protein
MDREGLLVCADVIKALLCEAFGEKTKRYTHKHVPMYVNCLGLNANSHEERHGVGKTTQCHVQHTQWPAVADRLNGPELPSLCVIRPSHGPLAAYTWSEEHESTRLTGEV